MPTKRRRAVRSAVPPLRPREAVLRQDVEAAGHREDRPADGSVIIQFGGEHDGNANYLAIVMSELYRAPLSAKGRKSSRERGSSPKRSRSVVDEIILPQSSSSIRFRISKEEREGEEKAGKPCRPADTNRVCASREKSSYFSPCSLSIAENFKWLESAPSHAMQKNPRPIAFERPWPPCAQRAIMRSRREPRELAEQLQNLGTPFSPTSGIHAKREK